MRSETGCAPKQPFPRPANSLDCDLCHGFRAGLQANVATAIPAEIHLAQRKQADELPLEISCSQCSGESRTAHRIDPPLAGPSDGARANPEPMCARPPRKNRQ